MRKSPPTLRRILLAVLAIGLLAAACGGDESSTTAAAPTAADGVDGAAAGDWPHDFSAPLIGGGTFEAGDFEGQDLVLWFWAPW